MIYGASTVTTLSSITGLSVSPREASFLPGLSESYNSCNDRLMLCAADAPSRCIFLAEAESIRQSR